MNISKQNGALVVPDQPTIPFIEGDGQDCGCRSIEVLWQ